MAARNYPISVWLLLLLVSTNAGHVMLTETGTYDYMGVEPNIGDTSEIDQAQEKLSTGRAGSGSVTQSFVAIASSIVGVFNAVLNTIFLWRPLLKSLGFPGPIVDWGTGTYAFILGTDLFLLWRGA